MMTDAPTAEQAQQTDKIQVSSSTPTSVYRKNILRNSGRSGFSKLITLTGLGDATKKTIELSNELIKYDFKITGIHTELHSSAETKRVLPKITVTLAKGQTAGKNGTNATQGESDSPSVPIGEVN